ncbi:hypothetical protein SAMN02745121_08569 [Nannocystis exedens]|uniref:Uncharacterized protein n=1 Tax=Nannocystis exedens TaxID=54 RepID=A0A1I2IAJ7_9BACT|nr:hypothetical protein [Nannocystis exedens]PCC73142.1 hypothetical protein NAEX_06230 [Nannocystis exedens]SFF39352.1 hypothetical protein SAMN02745121_08569 [Nannocystis exedens]
MSDECQPLNLGGRTKEDPCKGAFGYCTPYDYFEMRKMLQVVRNGLVTRLTSYDTMLWERQRKGEKVSYTPATQAALDLCNGDSWNVLAEHGDSNWNYLKMGEELAGPIRTFIEMATRCHAASCDVDAAIRALGGVTPSAPAQPVPTQTIIDQIFKRAGEAAGGVAKFAAIGLALWGGAQFIKAREKGDS